MAEEKALKSALVLYGSQTGTAVDLCNRLEFELRRYYIKVRMQSMDEWFESHCSLGLDGMARALCDAADWCLLVTSTTGNGECPDNMKQLWKRWLLQKRLSPDCLKDLRFAVFGLGDSSYFPLYNTAARRLYQRLLTLGAQTIHGSCARGLGDAQSDLGIAGAFQEWTKSLLNSVKYRGFIEDSSSVPLKYAVMMKEEEECGVRDSDEKTEGFEDNNNKGSDHGELLLNGTVISNDRMTEEDHWQCVRHVCISVSKHTSMIKMNVKPGDVLTLHIANSIKTVTQMCELMIGGSESVERAKSMFIQIERPEGRSDYPTILTVFQLFRRWIGLNERVTPYFFARLAPFCNDEMFQSKCLTLSQVESMDFYDYCETEHRSFLEVLIDFKSALSSTLLSSLESVLSFVLSVVPKLKPRQYSMSGIEESESPETLRVSLTAALVEFKTPLGRQITGLASRFIRDECIVDSKVPVSFHKGSFVFPSDLDQRNIIAIGPGTGAAPFICLAKHRLYLKLTTFEPIGSVLFFAGHRNRGKDFLFEKEWARCIRAEVVSDVRMAFSRDSESETCSLKKEMNGSLDDSEEEKSVKHCRYVSDSLMEYGREVCDMIRTDPRSIVLLAGRSGDMPKGVRNALVQLIARYWGSPVSGDTDKAEKVVRQLETHKRYQLETWAV